MAGKRNKNKKGKTKTVSRKSSRSPRPAEKQSPPKHALKSLSGGSMIPNTPPASALLAPPQGRPVFSIEVGSINGETTIGDLIVAFPGTRRVLMKHGLRFDVEDAGYLYMTLNVFSAIYGLATNNLVQELDTASREPPIQSSPQQLRPITTAPTA